MYSYCSCFILAYCRATEFKGMKMMFRPLQVNKMGCFAFFKTIDLIFMLRKSILFYILTVSFILPVFAQNYITSLGVRVADNTDFRMAGLSLQQRIFKKTTLEAVIQSDFQKNTTFHLLGEYHQYYNQRI